MKDEEKGINLNMDYVISRFWFYNGIYISYDTYR